MILLPGDYCRYEWYQTETHVVVSVLVKTVKKEDLKCDIQESSVSFQIWQHVNTEYGSHLILVVCLQFNGPLVAS